MQLKGDECVCVCVCKFVKSLLLPTLLGQVGTRWCFLFFSSYIIFIKHEKTRAMPMFYFHLQQDFGKYRAGPPYAHTLCRQWAVQCKGFPFFSQSSFPKKSALEIIHNMDNDNWKFSAGVRAVLVLRSHHASRQINHHVLHVLYLSSHFKGLNLYPLWSFFLNK